MMAKFEMAKISIDIHKPFLFCNLDTLQECLSLLAMTKGKRYSLHNFQIGSFLPFQLVP